MTLHSLGIIIKRNKFLYYVQNIYRQLIPKIFHQSILPVKLSAIKKYNKDDLLKRVNYYNKLEIRIPLGDKSTALKELKIFKRPKSYNFDIFEYTRYFKEDLRANFLFGDIIHVPPVPSIQKSRPIAGYNANAVLLKLDKKRHFVFIKDKKDFSSKKNMLIGRGAVHQLHRIHFMELYFNHPMCDLGQVNKTGGNAAWVKPKMAIAAHLEYKFILSLEGNDVATNLKWIMSSNSIAVMPKPKNETWFMEGKLIANHHYILIKDDYSDLEERLNYYIAHEKESKAIIKNANEFTKQFLDKRKEDLISLMVLKKYFYCTGQTLSYEL